MHWWKIVIPTCPTLLVSNALQRRTGQLGGLWCKGIRSFSAVYFPLVSSEPCLCQRHICTATLLTIPALLPARLDHDRDLAGAAHHHPGAPAPSLHPGDGAALRRGSLSRGTSREPRDIRW